jgi:hypothetical protein
MIAKDVKDNIVSADLFIVLSSAGRQFVVLTKLIIAALILIANTSSVVRNFVWVH